MRVTGVTPEAIRRLMAERAYRQMTAEHYPVGAVEHEPGFVTGYDDTGRSEAWDVDDYDRATGRAGWR